jgi:hypothetical protein
MSNRQDFYIKYIDEKPIFYLSNVSKNIKKIKKRKKNIDYKIKRKLKNIAKKHMKRTKKI